VSILSIDPQANGWRDDGSESGLIRTEHVRGNLVPIPFDALQYYAELSGGATATSAPTGVYSNPDGSGTGVNVSIPSGADAGVRLWMPFYGRGFGVRWRRDSGLTATNLSVVVDGEAVGVDTGNLPHLVAEAITTQITDAEARAITHPLLPNDGPHVAEIHVIRDPSATATITLYGFLLDERAGYRPLPRVAQMLTTTVLTAAAVEIPVGRGTALAMRAIRKVIYTNITAGPVTVTVKNGANTVWARSIPANETIEFDPGTAIAASSAFTHQASAATSVNATVIGEY